MKVTLRTFADFREVIGAREKDLVLPDGGSVGGLLKVLCENHPGLRERLFDAAGQLKPYILVLINGRNIGSLRQLDTPLADRDVISLFPPVAGG